MTNLIHTSFILQYVHYNPLHVWSITCSSSGGWTVLMQHLVSSSQSVAVRCTGWERTKKSPPPHWDSIPGPSGTLGLATPTALSRATKEHRPSIKETSGLSLGERSRRGSVWWIRPVERELLRSSLSTVAPDSHWLRGRYQMLHQYNSTSSWWACNARNM